MKDKMKNIHILPTDKPSRLWTNNLRRRLELDEFPSQHPTNIAKHIYITSDEEIKLGDWIYDVKMSVVKCPQILSRPNYFTQFCKKIILTTDTQLIKDGVQAIDDEFLEWFVTNPSCEEVEVEEFEPIYGHQNNSSSVLYKTIIPKEEPKKVLTEEDIFNQKDIDAVTDYINKEQQKQHLIDMMESDEELGLYDETIDSIKLEEVFGSKHCLYSVIENKLAILYRNQEKILSAIKILNNGRK